MSDMKKNLIDLSAQRTKLLDDAENALNSGDRTAYDSAMERVSNMNIEIENIKTLQQERERQILTQTPGSSETRDMAEERGNDLMNGKKISLTVDEVRRGLLVNEATTVATGGLVAPVGAGTEVHDPLGNLPSSIVDQVWVQDCSGMTGWQEPYVISELEAVGGKPETNAGTKRTESKAPTFGVAEINPYELTVTSYVDRNIARLTNAKYFEKIYNMAMRAMRRKLASLIAVGDQPSNPKMHGILNAKNKAGANIFATENVTKIDESLMDALFFAYGSDEAIGQNARLYLTKKDLAALGKLRNADKQRVYKIRPDGTNPNSGVIEDGGTIIPYTILPGLKSLDGATQTTSPIQTMAYGDPMNYMLGLFGDYSIRVDESIKGEERMLTILGDAMVGGNLVVDKGFVVATLPKNGG